MHSSCMIVYSEQFYGVKVKLKQGRLLFQRDYLLKKLQYVLFCLSVFYLVPGPATLQQVCIVPQAGPGYIEV